MTVKVVGPGSGSSSDSATAGTGSRHRSVNTACVPWADRTSAGAASGYTNTSAFIAAYRDDMIARD